MRGPSGVPRARPHDPRAARLARARRDQSGACRLFCRRGSPASLRVETGSRLSNVEPGLPDATSPRDFPARRSDEARGGLTAPRRRPAGAALGLSDRGASVVPRVRTRLAASVQPSACRTGAHRAALESRRERSSNAAPAARNRAEGVSLQARPWVRRGRPIGARPGDPSWLAARDRGRIPTSGRRRTRGSAPGRPGRRNP